MNRSRNKVVTLTLSICLLAVNLFGFRTTNLAHAGEHEYTAEQVKIDVVIGKSRGHLAAALANWENGDTNLAATHAGHAKAELVPIADLLKEKKLDTDVNTALSAFADLAGTAGDKTALEDAQTAADKALIAASDALLGELRKDPKFLGSAISELVHSAEHEYEEALKDGKIAEIIEYQDAKGFFDISRTWFAALTRATDDGSGATQPASFAVVQQQFDALKVMFPNFVKPPAEPAAMDVVETAVDTIMKTLSDELQLPVFEEASGNEQVAKIKALIADALMHYEMNEADEAYEKAASAYLDGFEALEGALGAKDNDLMVLLEVQFKDLRDAIKAGKPLADIKKIADDLNVNLDKAAALLTE
jgi:hypothetical protein